MRKGVFTAWEWAHWRGLNIGIWAFLSAVAKAFVGSSIVCYVDYDGTETVMN